MTCHHRQLKCDPKPTAQSGDLPLIVPTPLDSPEGADRTAGACRGGSGPGGDYRLTAHSRGGVRTRRGRTRTPAVGGAAAGDGKEVRDAGRHAAVSAVLQRGS